MNEIPSFVPLIVGWLGLLEGVRKLFKHHETVVKPSTAQDVTQWLKNSPRVSGRWPGHFEILFDSFFGAKHWSLRCFLRASMVSAVAVLILSFVWVAIHRDEFTAFVTDDQVRLFLMAMLLSFVGVNVVADYLSLLETRYMIRVIARQNDIRRVIPLLLIDVAEPVNESETPSFTI